LEKIAMIITREIRIGRMEIDVFIQSKNITGHSCMTANTEEFLEVVRAAAEAANMIVKAYAERKGIHESNT
jgi:hypothetical protein